MSDIGENTFTAEDYIKLQYDRYETLKQIFTNFKKDSVSRKTKIYHEQRLSRVNDLNNEFDSTHKIIICSNVQPTVPYLKNKVSLDFEECFLEVICAITESLEKLHPIPSTVQENEPQPPAPIVYNTSAVKLPHLPVPKFSGKFTDWPAFHDAFNRLVHLDSTLNAIQKFHYLKMALPDDRDVDIHQLLLTEPNYTTAWETIVKRYNNPRILFMHHMNTLHNLPSQSKERAEDLKSMLNVANVCINEFKRLGIPIDDCNHWIVHHLSSKLPKETHQAWEYFVGSSAAIPDFTKFSDFLNQRLITIDAIENRCIAHQQHQITKSSSDANKASKRFSFSKHETKSFHVTTSVPKVDHCVHCGDAHIIRRCPNFLAKDCFQRKSIADKAKLCLNCLSKSHQISQCTSTKNCLQCGQRHHTLLHFPSLSRTLPSSSEQAFSTQASLSASQPTNSFVRTLSSNTNNNSNTALQRSMSSNTAAVYHAKENASSATTPHCNRNILLASALVLLINQRNGQPTIMRALIDQGSEGTIISEQAVQTLGLKRTATTAEIIGVGQSSSSSNFVVNFSLRSCVNSNYSIDVVAAYVLNSLATKLPSVSIKPQHWPHIQGLSLADPSYYQPKRIDLIIGADMMSQILLPEMRIGASDQPIAQNTHLGWILFGHTQSSSTHPVSIRCNHAKFELESLVHKFFELEHVPEERTLSDEDRWCQKFYERTHIRQSNGKYLVRLPLKSNFDSNQTLGKSKQIALNRFHQLERRLRTNSKLREQYTAAITDYFELKQIMPVTTTEQQHWEYTALNQPTVTSCVLPHHAVIKEESSTTKVRIVFDASAKTSNGRSLNDALCVGPPLQNDLSAVILNWRMHRFVFTSDIQKMYRCIDMHSDDAQYQRILWRNVLGDIQEYYLTTVTFGTASAPYTAIRTIHQIAIDERHRFPLAEHVLKHEMYVDDILTGSHSIDSTIQIRNQLTLALKSAGMEFRKWASNSPSILESIPIEHQSNSTVLDLNSNVTIKTLGMCWQPNPDFFQYKINFDIDATATKRVVLSTIARLFDPLGLMAPIIVVAKVLLKLIWSTKITRSDQSTTGLEWDEALPESINQRWQQFLMDLSSIDLIKIPRWLNYLPDNLQSIELHTFCDGSSSAYAANVYIRIEYCDGSTFTHLLLAKSKVTPSKPLTIPKVELCGALLATKLAEWTNKNLRTPLSDIPTYFWTDASIVLYWIHGDINRWKIFVANRIGMILETTAPNQWQHISTDENPADCATRGLTPVQLSNFNLWWSGPQWLSSPKPKLKNFVIDENLLDEKPLKIKVNFAIPEESVIFKYSSYNKLVRITAYLQRFNYNSHATNRSNRRHGPLTVLELNASLLVLVRLVQREAFSKEINAMQSQQPLPNKSKLKGLVPFIDSHDILRVRGRCQRANLPYSQKHPIILPSAHHFTKLVINNSHLNTLHGGAQLTLANIFQQFWILKPRQTVRNELRKCIKCFRSKPEISSQLMGNLPYHRVNPPKRPFLATGVDYTGAIELKSSKYRGNTSYKGYIAIFICLATKAVHLEAVTGMSTECFLWALQRFIGRRGICNDIYSDCGTNFVGANKVLQTNRKAFIEAVEREIVPKLSAQNIQWHFNPPHSPNFGGLWEANVKSVKYHLKRVVDGTRLTYEELSTVLVRIEACLNSRPLCPLTADPDDLDALTPGHFLIGDTLLSPPHETSGPQCLSKTYLAIQNMTNQFWSKWTSDWLSHLQARPKWRQEMTNLEINDLVIIKDDRIPTNEWILGRVVELHPGEDNLVRVVTLRTKSGLYKRSVSKICRLPIPTYTQENS